MAKILCDLLSMPVMIVLVLATMMIHPLITVVIGTYLFFDAWLFWPV